MGKQVQIVAHRGYAAVYPENTAVALEAAVNAGATLLEFDVQLTRDHVPVLLHDADFMRTAGDPRSVVEHDFSELADIDVGEPDRFGTRYAGTSISRVADIAALLADWPDVTAFVEIKRHSVERFGLAAVFDALLPALEPMLGRCVIISFVAEVLTESRSRCAAPTGWAVRKWDDAAREQAGQLQPDYLFCNVEKLPPEPEALWQGPWEWVIYEITDIATALQLAARGVRYIESMKVSELLNGLKERPDT